MEMAAQMTAVAMALPRAQLCAHVANQFRLFQMAITLLLRWRDGRRALPVFRLFLRCRRGERRPSRLRTPWQRVPHLSLGKQIRLQGVVFYFTDAGLGGEPGSQGESRRGEAHSNPFGHSGAAHHIADFSDARSFPFSMMATGSAISSRSEATWEVMKTVLPSRLRRRNQILKLEAGFGIEAGGRSSRTPGAGIVNDGAGRCPSAASSAGEAAYQGVVFCFQAEMAMTSRTRAGIFEGSSL